MSDIYRVSKEIDEGALLVHAIEYVFHSSVRNNKSETLLNGITLSYFTFSEDFDESFLLHSLNTYLSHPALPYLTFILLYKESTNFKIVRSRVHPHPFSGL